MKKSNSLRVALVVPHIFMHRDILPRVIFSPGHLAIALAGRLHQLGLEVTLFSPGPIDSDTTNITADLSKFDDELTERGEDYLSLLSKHPFTFVTLARQVQSELIAKAYAMANDNLFDIVHIYTNEEDIALPFAQLCHKPVVFTHHDPFNFLVKYRNNYPKYKHLNWLSMSQAQRKGMPPDTNWVGNIYHGLDDPALTPVVKPSNNYAAYMGRIIEQKGVHLAIAAINKYNETAITPLTLKIAGKHYAEESKDHYWQEMIEPDIGEYIEYAGFLDSSEAKRDFLGNARVLLVPSLFDEPFGMVTIESFACGTPVIALSSGSLPEVIENTHTGYIVEKNESESAMAKDLARAIKNIGKIDRANCREAYETRFTLTKMANEHAAVYDKLSKQSQDQS